MSRAWPTVHNADDPIEAQAACDYLQAHDIEVRVQPHPDPALAAAPVSPGWGVVKVSPDNESRAIQLLRRWEEEPPKTLIDQRPLGVDRTRVDRPSFSPPLERASRSSGGLGWILLASLIANAVLAALWWDAEQRASAIQSRESTNR